MTRHFPLSRRTLFKTAALGAAALASPHALTRTAMAQEAGSPAGADAPRFNRIKVGGLEMTMLLDGGRAMGEPHKIFGIDQPQKDVEAPSDRELPAPWAKFQHLH